MAILQQGQPILENLKEFVLGIIQGSHSLCLPKHNKLSYYFVTVVPVRLPTTSSYSLLPVFTPTFPPYQH